MGFLTDEPPELLVPEGAHERPPGAAVDLSGQARCITCGERHPIERLDVVGQGYRCAPCSHRAEVAVLVGAVDAGIHLDRRERAALRASGTKLMVGGAFMLAGGVASLVISVELVQVAIALLGGGLCVMAYGNARRGAAG